VRKIGVIVSIESVWSFTFRVFDEVDDLINVGSIVVVPNRDRVDNDLYALARVVHIERKNVIVDSRVISHLSSEEVLEPLRERGFALSDLAQYTLAKAVVIGRRVGGRFERPRKPPKPFDYVYAPSDEVLRENLLGRDEFVGIEVGKVSGTDIPALLNADRLVTQHCAILAATGGGKSYLAGLIVERLFLRARMPIIVIDPHGEYSAMQYPAEDTEDAEEVASNVKVLIPGKVDTRRIDEYYARKFGRPRRYTRFGINPRSLPLRLLVRLLEYHYGLSDAQRRVVEEGWVELKGYNEEDPPLTSVSEIVKEVLNAGSHVAPLGHAGEQVLHGVGTKLRLLLESKPFFVAKYGDSYLGEPIKVLRPRELSDPKIYVFDLSPLELVDQQILVSVILDQVFRLAVRKELPPTFIVLEEAHLFAPSKSKSPSREFVLRIIREGRKFGVGLCIISQRPSKIDPDVLSQCMTQIFKRMINPNDLKYVSNVAEYLSWEDLQEIKVLNEDDALVTGVAVPMPILVKVGRRLTHHGGTAPTIVGERSRFNQA